MEYSEQVVEVLSKAVVKALDQRLAEYDTQIDKKLRRYVFGTENLMPLSVTGEQIAQGSVVGSNIANGTITGANILAMTITGDLLVDGTLTGVKIENGSISTKKLVSKEVETDVMNAVIANIATANIDWANVKTMNADNAVIIKAVIEQLQAESITTGNLTASLADVGTAIIKDATIDAAHIKDLKADVALIDRSVEGKTFIRDLSVSDANIVSLLVNKLFVQTDELDAQGNPKTYNIFVNENFNPDDLSPEELAKLPILTKRIQVDGGGIIDNSLPANAIVKDSITVRELNAGEIFADEAFVNKLTAGIGNFGTLFTNEAIVGQLKTHLINSDYLKIMIGDEAKDAADTAASDAIDNWSKDNPGFDPENWDKITNTVMTFDKNGILMRGGTIHLNSGSLLFEANTGMTMKSGANITMQSGANMYLQSGSAMTLQAGSTMTLQGSTLNLIAKTNTDGTKTNAVLNIQSGGALNIDSAGEMTIKSGGKLSMKSGSSFEVSGSDVSLKANSKLSLIGSDIELKGESSDYSYNPARLTVESGAVTIKGNSFLQLVGSYIVLGDDTATGDIYVNSGEININSSGAFKVSTGGKFSVDAEDDSSYIRFGGTEDNPNFMLGNQGVVKAVSGIFDRLTVGGNSIVSAAGSSLSDRIIVSDSEPTDQHGVIWVHPTGSSGGGTGGGSVTTSSVVDYTYSVNSYISLSSMRTITFQRSGGAIAGDKCSYGIKFTVYSFNGSAKQGLVNVYLQRQSGGKTITIVKSMPTGYIGDGGYIYVDTLNSPSEELENMTSEERLNVIISISTQESSTLRLVNGELTLRCKSTTTSTTRSVTSSGNQNCEIIYIP